MIFDFKMTTGKHKGRMMSYIVHMDPGYYYWMTKNYEMYCCKKLRRRIRKWITLRNRFYDTDSSIASTSSSEQYYSLKTK